MIMTTAADLRAQAAGLREDVKKAETVINDHEQIIADLVESKWRDAKAASALEKAADALETLEAKEKG